MRLEQFAVNLRKKILKGVWFDEEKMKERKM